MWNVNTSHHALNSQAEQFSNPPSRVMNWTEKNALENQKVNRGPTQNLDHFPRLDFGASCGDGSSLFRWRFPDILVYCEDELYISLPDMIPWNPYRGSDFTGDSANSVVEPTIFFMVCHVPGESHDLSPEFSLFFES